jgi:hypothetical protein
MSTVSPELHSLIPAQGRDPDLGGFAYSGGETVSWSQSGASGSLKVIDGVQSASLTLIGTYTNSSFQLGDDVHSGTFVADLIPPRAKVRFAVILGELKR